jgi:tRNA-modifying protein YgfZ
MNPMALLEDSYRTLREACVQHVPQAALVRLTGSDRKGWLQGQATHNLERLDVGWSRGFCLCSPTGQILAVCRVWALPDSLLVGTDLVTLPALLQRIEDMVILEDVQAELLSERMSLFSYQGPDASALLRERWPLPSLDAGLAEAGFALRHDRTGSGGWDLWVEADATPLPFDLVPPVDAGAWDVARLEAGIPLVGRDIGSKTLPPELGAAFEEEHVSYRKGCYTGQEVLMRIHARGHTNRVWVGLLADAPLEPDLAVVHPGCEGAGVVTSAGVSPAIGPIAGAMLRREAARPGDLVVVQTSSGEVEAEVRPMPLLARE